MGKLFFNLYLKHKESESDSLMNIVNYNLFENNEQLNSPFTMNELKVIMKELKNGKASG